MHAPTDEFVFCFFVPVSTLALFSIARCRELKDQESIIII